MIVVVYFIFRLQGVPPLNPAHIEGMEPTLAFNTAISFMADTNLQHYSGENGLSYLSQLIGITFLMFCTSNDISARYGFYKRTCWKRTW